VGRRACTATGWTFRGSNPGGGPRFSAPVQTGPGAHPVSCTIGTGSFPRVTSGRGVTLTPHPLLVLWSRKSRAILLLPLWVVGPLQSLSACTSVHCVFLPLRNVVAGTARFTAREKAPETPEYESGRPPEPVWTHCRRETNHMPIEQNDLRIMIGQV